MPGKYKKLTVLCLLVVLPLSGVWQTGLGAWIHTKAIIAQTLLEAAWTDTLKGQKEVKPWPWADTWPVSRLTVPRLGISRIVLAGASGEALAFGPGLLLSPENPGYSGNTVIAGHRDTHFRFLQKIKTNDLIMLQTGKDSVHLYRVSELLIINENQVQLLQQDDDRLMLITCYPFHAVTAGGPLRYAVIAKRILPLTV